MAARLRFVGDVAFLPRPDPDIEREMDAKFTRIGERQWRVPQPQGVVAKVTEFVKTTTSGEASPEVIGKRVAACSTCPAMYQAKDGRRFCGACGCGRWLLSQLDSGPAPKLKWAKLRCPLQRF